MTHLHTPTLGYILKGYPRISETFISNEILLLEKLGFTLRLFSMRQPRESFSHPSVKKIRAKVDYLPTELLPEFSRLLLPNIFLAVKKPHHYRRCLRTALHGVIRGRELATLKHLLQAGFLTNKHLLPDDDIVQLHGHFAHSPTSVTMFASLLSDIPFSFTAHAKDIYTSDKTKLCNKIERAGFVVTCTRHNRDYLQKLSTTCTTPIYCIYHGIDLELFQNNSHHHEMFEPYRILTVARLTEKKGLPTVYRALALLDKQGIRFHHTLIGDGDDREKILSLISTLSLGNCCRWLGTRTHEEVLKHFKESDLFVLGCEVAANGDRDGIPNVLVESLAMGVPALSTRVSAIPEIVIDGKTGMLVPPENPESLARGMITLLTDRDLRTQLIGNGKKHVQTHFDNGLWIEELARIFCRHNSAFVCPPLD